MEEMVQSCEGQSFMLNVTKTKGIIFDPRSTGDDGLISVSGEKVDQVWAFYRTTMLEIKPR